MDLAGTFRKPFAEQVAAFRLRLADLRPTARWLDVWQAEHDRAFMVAGALKADLLADLAGAVEKAIADGTGIEAFRAEFRAIVERRGWHGWTGEGTKKGEAWRTRVIYKTNMATTYAAGRWAQLMKSGFPLLVYRHGGSLDPRIEHLGWDGLILPADHPFWATHAPPNGWGCSCYVIGARSERDAVRKGGKRGKTLPEGWAAPTAKTGAPAGIDKGWAYAPGASVAEAVAQVADKLRLLPPQLGSRLGEEVSPQIDTNWEDWLQQATSKRSDEMTLLGVMSASLLEALAARELAPASAEIMIRAGLVSGPKAARHIEAGDALTPEQWKMLPELMRRPRAVLLDKRTRALLYILESDGASPQIAVRMDYRRGKRGDSGPMNAVVSAYVPKLPDLLGRVVGGLIEVLLGKLG